MATIPWILYNIYCQNVTLLLDSDEVVSHLVPKFAY